MSNFRGPSLTPDTYRSNKRAVILNFSDGVAGTTTRHYLGTVDKDSPIEVVTDIVALFNGTSPSIDVVLENAAGTVLATLTTAAVVASTVLGYAKARSRFLTTEKADVVVKFQRPAAASTAGQAVFELSSTHKPSRDASSPAAYAVP